MKIKTAELIGPALDWTVGTCEGYTELKFWPSTGSVTSKQPNGLQIGHDYSTCWLKGGPIIEREKVSTEYPREGEWVATHWDGNRTPKFMVVSGPTLLIAAMRCLVARMLGDEVEIPDDLTRP